MNKYTSGAALFGASLVGWVGLFKLGRHCLTRYFQAWEWQVSHHHTLSIANAFVSSVQGLASSICGVLVVWHCGHDVMRTPHPLAAGYAWVAAAYFIYDTWSMYQVYTSGLSGDGGELSFSCRLTKFLKCRTLLVLHHLVLTAFLLPILIYRDGLGDFFVGCFYCVELSSPFTNMRVILSRLGLKNTRWYTANGVLMMVTFGVCRILVFPYMYLCYGGQHGLGVWGVMRTIPLHCNLGCTLILLPQLHWLRLMVRGAFKVSRGKTITDADEKID